MSRFNVDGTLDCPDWCGRLTCANGRELGERWHRSDVRFMPTVLMRSDAGRDYGEPLVTYVSQNVRELEAVVNLDLGETELLRLRPVEARQLIRDLQDVVAVLDDHDKPGQVRSAG